MGCGNWKEAAKGPAWRSCCWWWRMVRRRPVVQVAYQWRFLGCSKTNCFYNPWHYRSGKYKTVLLLFFCEEPCYFVELQIQISANFCSICFAVFPDCKLQCTGSCCNQFITACAAANKAHTLLHSTGFPGHIGWKAWTKIENPGQQQCGCSACERKRWNIRERKSCKEMGNGLK